MISEKEVEKVAFLARLSLTAEEKQAYAKQLSSILGYFQQMSEIKTDGVEPLVTPTDVTPHLRTDKTENWPKSADALQQAPERMGNLFKVPPVVGG
jgi:aspartyl-tRNA(Asn)/glutamyl-tRNA(Gln) amidotransferase subunit C